MSNGEEEAADKRWVIKDVTKVATGAQSRWDLWEPVQDPH